MAQKEAKEARFGPVLRYLADNKGPFYGQKHQFRLARRSKSQIRPLQRTIYTACSKNELLIPYSPGYLAKREKAKESNEITQKISTWPTHAPHNTLKIANLAVTKNSSKVTKRSSVVTQLQDTVVYNDWSANFVGGSGASRPPFSCLRPLRSRRFGFMRSHKTLALLTLALATSLACKATTVPFGVASAYNLFAVGTVDAHGNTLIAGNVSTPSDSGRIAAAGIVLNAATISGTLNADPFGALAPFDLVGENGINVGNYININSHGNVYGAPSPGTHFNFNGGGHLVTAGGSGINFNALRSTLDAQTVFLGALGTTGTIVGTNSPLANNPSYFVLLGTDPNLNVFNITAAQLASVNNPIDIIAPVGSTIIINVSGTNIIVGGGLFYNNVQHSGDDPTDDRILFNFPDATTVQINKELSASVLAPFAILTGDSQMDGNFIAAQINVRGEVHNVEFIGDLPQPPTGPPIVPEPGTLMLVGTGALSLVGALRRIKRT